MPWYQFVVNGTPQAVEAWDGDMPLFYALRNDLGLHAATFGCGMGQCGACTVLVDDRPARSCMLKISEAGVRLRTVPFTRARVRTMLAGAA